MSLARARGVSAPEQRAGNAPATAGTKLGSNLGGIRSIEDIRQRCYVDEAGCWHWRMSRDGEGRPSLYLPEQRIRTSLGVAIGHLLGKPAPKGKNWFVACSTANCANPEHRKLGTRAQQMRKVRGQPIPLERRARIAATKRAQHGTCAEMIAALRTSDETTKALAERFGIKYQRAWRIRYGRSVRPLGVSVFEALR